MVAMPKCHGTSVEEAVVAEAKKAAEEESARRLLAISENKRLRREKPEGANRAEAAERDVRLALWRRG